METVPTFAPAANWDDLDGDGIGGEKVIGKLNIQPRENEKYQLSELTIVLEPKPKPAVIEKDYLDLLIPDRDKN